MHQVNTRGTFLASKPCLPLLRQADNPHLLNLSPPLNLNPSWVGRHPAYTMAKYGMSPCVLGMAAEVAQSVTSCHDTRASPSSPRRAAAK